MWWEGGELQRASSRELLWPRPVLVVAYQVQMRSKTDSASWQVGPIMPFLLPWHSHPERSHPIKINQSITLHQSAKSGKVHTASTETSSPERSKHLVWGIINCPPPSPAPSPLLTVSMLMRPRYEECSDKGIKALVIKPPRRQVTTTQHLRRSMK